MLVAEFKRKENKNYSPLHWKKILLLQSPNPQAIKVHRHELHLNLRGHYETEVTSLHQKTRHQQRRQPLAISLLCSLALPNLVSKSAPLLLPPCASMHEIMIIIIKLTVTVKLRNMRTPQTIWNVAIFLVKKKTIRCLIQINVSVIFYEV